MQIKNSVWNGTGGRGKFAQYNVQRSEKGVYKPLPIVCVFSAARCFSEQGDALHKISPNRIVLK